MLKKTDPSVNLHVFSADCPEIDRMLAFRDHLRTNEADRQLYERTKRELASQHWAYVQDYADAKSDVVEEIIARAPSPDILHARGQPVSWPVATLGHSRGYSSAGRAPGSHPGGRRFEPG